MIWRLLLVLFVPGLLFCLFGFLAAGELNPPASTIWKSGYASAALLFLAGAIWAMTSRRRQSGRGRGQSEQSERSE